MDGETYLSEARFWSDTPPYSAGRTWRLHSPGQGRLSVMGGFVRLAHELPGKPAEEHVSHHSFDKLSGGDVLL